MSAALLTLIDTEDSRWRAVPQSMRDAARWMCYELEPDPKHPDKPRKVPKSAIAIGKNASSTDASTWCTFDRACAALRRNPRLHGLGFALGDGWVGVDLDHCVYDDGDIEGWARDVVEQLDSYAEFSPSGTGIHVIVRGHLPDGRRKKGAFEMYDSGRYFTVSGRMLLNGPSEIQERTAALAEVHAKLLADEDLGTADDRGRGGARPTYASFDEQALAVAFASKTGDRLRALIAGTWNGRYPSQSEADLALCNDLMFWFRGNDARVDSVFRSSGLMRSKWDEQHGQETYGQRTVAKAKASWLRNTPTAYDPKVEDGVVPFSEDAIASAFTRRYAGTLRFTAEWGKWFMWDGVSRWVEDSTLRVYDDARGICREIAANAPDAKVRATIVKATTVSAIERLAKADREHAIRADQWDANAWLLNTPMGVVDLRTGDLRPGEPTDYLTRQTAAAPGDSAPTWLSFLERVTGGDRDLQLFLQRMAGYALTGDISEHALFFCYGTGGNGKGVFLNTLTNLLGDYASVAPIETFTASTSDRHPTELAMLRGARLVSSQETEQGRRWAEARLKALTGGDPITARFMRGDFFTFAPSFKLVIAGNHRPHLSNVDEAIKRRLHLIPFTQTIRADERDPMLMDKLRAEWPGILRWAIDGCLEWQRIGLQAPESVKAATADYFSTEDSLQAWIEECCITGTMAWGSSQSLYASWQHWAEERGEAAGSIKSFSETLKNRGFDKGKRQDARGFLGIAVRPREEPPYV